MNTENKKLIKLLEIKNNYYSAFDYNIKYISAYLSGYNYSQIEAGYIPVDPFSKNLFFNRLDSYIRNSYHINMTVSMYSIINFFTENTENAFHNFYEAIDIVLNQSLESYVQSIKDNAAYVLVFPNKSNKVDLNRLVDLLKKIKERPGMYLGEKSLTGLSWFLTGYILSEIEIYENTDSCYVVGSFEKFLNDKHNYKDKRWDKIISFIEPTEMPAFDFFYKELTKYTNQLNKLTKC
ncbi:hypothetical protein M2475_001814 [Breznakia sp. PF5-3]|uniref:hypothetical protein n=1 Tax=unclassified Breznakia TaxID=2623764 RepID=UPI002405BC85|nr:MULTISPECIES: hypothetical protein [unclassified Breznakia]MDF9825359.1 hypothetical protein [Breznakia sp. PM6-1]MDF9836237.1 hypothetical protein [Breznakia sp. PF5-3]MDF9838523.1 hypothetical protein [Breznakia sp. PFB2-8]MDF9860482.1 hypothetical protein [Breznakia sp. PH5-24]